VQDLSPQHPGHFGSALDNKHYLDTIFVPQYVIDPPGGQKLQLSPDAKKKGLAPLFF